jgi:glutathione synthase/RimK-type ligase-like ATP-grasp enzyme
MHNEFTIKTNPDQHSELTIHPQKAAMLKLDNKKFAYLSFGNQKHFVKIKMDQDLSPVTIGLSQNIVKTLYLPDYPVYEIGVNQNEITIGPYIGLLVSNKDHKLTASRLNKMLVYVKEYAKLHGALVVFALNKVDRQNRLIEGYCYNHLKKYWQKGVFPYPTAIQRMIGLSANWKNHLGSVIGDKIFNSRFFNKWEMYQWFSQEPTINPHLPYTMLYHSPPDALEMLNRFPQIYLKPILGLQGRGIVRISKENQLYTFKYREHYENRSAVCDTPDQADEYLHKRIGHGRYLMQQAIDLLKYRGGIIDFRCVVQKNQANAWVCPTIIGRSGVPDSIVSNISSGGSAFPSEKILSKIFPASEEMIVAVRQEITALALTVCNKLTEYGINCGSLGIDIGLDLQGHLWLIEINNRDPDPSIALDIRDVQLYYTLKANPLFYGKYLAGFPELEH